MGPITLNCHKPQQNMLQISLVRVSKKRWQSYGGCAAFAKELNEINSGCLESQIHGHLNLFFLTTLLKGQDIYRRPETLKEEKKKGAVFSVGIYEDSI